MQGAPHGPWYYEQVDLGFNYRMPDMQAALGSSQMTRIDAYVRARHAIAKGYEQGLAHLPLILPWKDPDSYSAYHLYPVQIDAKRSSRSRKEVFEHLRGRGIGVNVHYIPVHTQPYYRALGFEGRSFPAAERYYANAMSLPLYPGLDEGLQARVFASLREALA
jgi:dTDP-4-amino-4,6-dideoxygalactose transaminase